MTSLLYIKYSIFDTHPKLTRTQSIGKYAFIRARKLVGQHYFDAEKNPTWGTDEGSKVSGKKKGHPALERSWKQRPLPFLFTDHKLIH
jgi:hypothetical protein